jgi:hypothetical protein
MIDFLKSKELYESCQKLIIVGDSMKKHILLNKMSVYKINKQTEKLENYFYNHEKGYWINKLTSSPLILEKNSIGPRTKKNDVETGEDHKGE